MARGKTVDQFAREKNEEETKKKNRGWDLEDIQIERDNIRHSYSSLNDQKSAFTSVMSEGINTQQSVFDQSAVFRVGRSNK